MAALCITPVKKVMIKSEEKTPVKKTSPPKDVVSKILMASVDLKEAIRRQSFFDHVKDGAPMKAKLAANKDGIEKIYSHLADFGRLPTTSGWQKSLQIADAWLQHEIVGASKDAERCRPDAIFLVRAMRKQRKSQRNKNP